MIILWIALLSLASGTLYRLGGWEKGNRLFRILGCPALTLSALWLLVGFQLSLWWTYLLCFGLSVAAISTYWDFLTGGEYDNFFLHGFVLGFAVLPIAVVGGYWIGFTIRCVILAVVVGVWSFFLELDVAEETGRGAAIVATLPLLLL